MIGFLACFRQHRYNCAAYLGHEKINVTGRDAQFWPELEKANFQQFQMQVAYSSEQKEVDDPSLEEMTRAAIRLFVDAAQYSYVI